MAFRIPMSSPDITDIEVQSVLGVLHTSALSIGPQVVEFERRFAEFCGARHAVAVSSGTAGLHMAVIASNVRDGDYVITTPFSFVASANAILYERGVPVFVDVDERTGNLDPALLAAAADDVQAGGERAERWLPRRQPATANASPRLAALLPVHAFGEPAEMGVISATAARHAIPVIEDACEAIGAVYRGQKVGLIGDAGVFAFYPNKQMTTAEGGMIVTDRDDWDGIFRSLRNQGRDVFDAWLRHSRLGFNYRLDELSAALGVAQVGRIEELLEKRECVADWYGSRLASIDGVRVMGTLADTDRRSWFVYVVRLAQGIDRDEVIRGLEKRGIPSRPYFSAIHTQPFYMQRFGYRVGDFPVCEALAESCLALPFSGVMTEEQVHDVVESLRECLETTLPAASRSHRPTERAVPR
jgi:perosamine synthetase